MVCGPENNINLAANDIAIDFELKAICADFTKKNFDLNYEFGLFS